MAILAGIDEAGFGPLLGPLMVSCTAFRVDEGLLETDLWETLRRSVGTTRKRLAGRLLICDSKKAYHRADGLGHLERTVLAALQCLGKGPIDVTELLMVLCPDCLPRLAAYPWYEGMQARRLAAGRADTRIAAKVFADDLQSHGATLMHLRSRCLDVGHYNRMVDEVKNKSQVLYITTTQLIEELLGVSAEQEVHILIDRQGGRAHYREHLLRSFADMDLRILEEGPQRSAYELTGRSRTLRLTFAVAADARYLPVALASMVSKYVRELLMQCINGYFSGMDPELKPTAGYWKDGLRFLDELRTRCPHVEIDDRRLVRSR